MKKNVKYIGSAIAVALLAAGAPVVIPMMIPVNIVQARDQPIDDNNTSEQPDAPLVDKINQFYGQFGKHIYVSGPNSLKDVLNTLSTNDYTENYYYFDPSSPKHIHDLQSDTALAKLKTNPILGQKENFGDAIFENNNGDYYYRDVLGYFSFHDASTDKDIDVSSSSKMQDYLNSLATAQWPFTVTIHLVQSTDKSDGTYKTPSLSNIDASLKSYSFEVDRSSLNIQKDTTTPVIAKGTKVITEDGLNSKLASGNNSLSVVYNYSKNSGNEYQSDMDKMAQPYYGSSFFANETDAIDYAKTPEFDTASVSAPKSVSLSDKGTYYQTVSYFLKGNSDSAVQAMLENSTDDRTGGKLDDYQTFINGKLGTDGTDYVLNKSAGYLTIVRPIQVGDGMTANLTDIQTTVGNDILSKENIGSLQYNGKIIPSTSTTDGKYYLDLQGKEEAPTEDISAGKFHKPGHYYRKITYTLNSGKASDYGIEVAPGSPDNTVTFMQKVNVEQIDKVVNPVSVTKGDSSTADTVTGVVTEYGINSNLLLTDDGSLVDTTKGQYKGVSFGTGYYLDDGKTTDSDVLNNKVKPVADVVDDNGNFAKSGDYLRTITFYLIDSTIDTDSLSELGSCKVGKDAEGNNTVTYIQKVHIAGYPVVKVVLSDDITIPINTPVSKYDSVDVPNGQKPIFINSINSEGEYDAYITDSDNKPLDNNESSIGKYVYSSKPDAIDGKNHVDGIILSEDSKELTGMFDRVKTYYRTVSFKLSNPVSHYNFEDSSGNKLEEGKDYRVDSEKNIVTFAQAIHVTGSTATATMPASVTVSYSKNISIKDTKAKLTDDTNGKTIATGTASSLYASPEDAYNSDSSKIVDSVKIGVTYYTKTSFFVQGNYDIYTKNEGQVINRHSPEFERNEISYIQQVIIEPEEVNTEINSQTADVGTDMNDFIKNNFGTYELHGTNNQEDAVGTGIPIYSINGQSINFSYYSNPTDALNQSNPVSETKFVKGKTYYLPIKFQLEKGDSVEHYNFDDANNLGIKVDENSNSVIYVLQIDVVDNSVTTTIPSITIPWGTDRDDVDNNKDGIDFKANATNESVINQDDFSFMPDENKNILYFSSRDKALAAINSGDSEPYELSNNKFSTPGTYYRIGGFIDKSDHDYNNENVIEKSNEDGSNTVLFLQELDVTPHPAKISIDSLSVDVGTSLNSDVMKNKDSYTLTDEDNNSLGTASIIGTDYYKTASDALNNQNNDDSVALTNDELNKGEYYRIITFKLTSGDFAQYYSFDTNTNENVRFNDDGTVSYAQQVLVDSNSVVAESISVATGTTTNDSKLTSTDNYGLKDKSKKDINATVAVDSDNYYTNSDAALANDKSGLADVKDRFTTPGTYYRLITFTPTVKLDKDSFDDPQVSVNDDGTVTYAQEIDVTAKKNSGGTTGSHSGSSTVDEWTYYQDAGVVTTKTTEPTYSLNNHANETIQNRALSENSSWVTDQYRVNNRTGVKQYRVATGEWIDANDVYFRDNDNGNDTEDEWTYYKDPGVVLTKETQEYYSLNNHANETIQNRALSEDSGWITDQYRVNNRTGVKQYRVATGEWIDSHDVIFVKDVQMIVNVDETKDYYNLYDIQKNTNSNRALEKKTSWLSDKVAIDYDGSTYYRVATNEWVKQENGVHLDTSVWYKN